MESPKIKILLEKYWAGNSTIAEEAQLKELFKTGIPKDFQKYTIVSQYAEVAKETEQTFDLSFLDEAIENETQKAKNINRRKWFWPTSIAASILIMILSVSYQWDDLQSVTAVNDTVEQTDTLNSAYEETIMALAYLSEKLNKGSASIYQLSAFDQTKKQVIYEND